MKQGIRIDHRILNTDLIASIEFDVRLGNRLLHVITIAGKPSLPIPADSDEGRALAWWFGGQADRVILAQPYRTIDIVQLHRDDQAVRRGVGLRGGQARVEPPRDRRTPAPLVAEACTDLGEDRPA